MNMNNEEKRLKLDYDFFKSLSLTFVILMLTSAIAVFNIPIEARTPFVRVTWFFIIIFFFLGSFYFIPILSLDRSIQIKLKKLSYYW